MENGAAARDAIDVRSQPIVGLSQFTESVQAFERTLKELEAVKADRDRLAAHATRLEVQLEEANTVAADAHSQLANERSQLAMLLTEVQAKADVRVEEANNRLNVEIANRMHYEAFFSGIKAQIVDFDLPADPVATVRKNGKRRREAASGQSTEELPADMKDKIAAAIGTGDVAVTVGG